MIELETIGKFEPRLRANMENHYSKPKGFVGRSICYAVLFNRIYYGAIVAGSAVLHLKGRDEFFQIPKDLKSSEIQKYINNIFYHVEPIGGTYPIRNFTVAVLKEFRKQSVTDWTRKYGAEPLGFETLIEMPRTGETYRRDGWQKVGETFGYTCKRTGGTGTDNWTGKRVWNTKELRPKNVSCRNIK